MRCKIWLTGKSGRSPAGWKSTRHFISRMTRLHAQLYRIAREAVINANKHAQARGNCGRAGAVGETELS